MPVPGSLVGATVGPVVHEVDARWTMAYAAALDDHLPAYFDTERAGGVVAHPLFPVCPEWPVIVTSRQLSDEFGVTADEVRRSVHATHDITVHRLVRPGDSLATTLEVVAVETTKPGARTTLRLVTTDAAGEPVATTTQDGIYLGVATDGHDRPDPDRPPPLDPGRTGEPIEVAVPIAAGAAHTYTECARIWNPIHTDLAVAHGAGLPYLILHGTATLAHAVSVVVQKCAGGDPSLVRRIRGRFAAMVPMPSTLTVRVWPPAEPAGGVAERVVGFEVATDDGSVAVRDGAVVLG